MTSCPLLIVEDDPIIAAQMRRTLERAGYAVSHAVDVPTALDEVERRRPELALIDVGLGATSGTELGRALAMKELPFVYVTAQTDAMVLDRAGSTGPVGLVSKPFSDNQLLGAVRVALANADTKNRYRSAVDRITGALLELGLVGAARPQLALADVKELAALSPREWEVLRGLLAHKRVPSIAKELHISNSTVRNHLKSIFAKVGVHSQEELLARLVRH